MNQTWAWLMGQYRAPISKLRASLVRAATVLRTVIGVPDYERYLTHVRASHPDVTPLSRDQFLAQCAADRYDRPGSRCC
jgi:uncharacterized short protein YbdD (DUF466 family)